MTVTEKILAKTTEKERVTPGEIVCAKIDVVMLHDIGTRGVLKVLEELGTERIRVPEIVIVPDHLCPPPTVDAAENIKIARDFAKRTPNAIFYEIGRHGICHQVMVEKGHVRPGETIVAPDSHTTTYGAVGAFGSGFGVTDVAIAVATGKLWLMVPESIRVEVNGDLQRGVTAKDVGLHLLGLIGDEGALYNALELSGSAVNNMSISSRMTLCNLASEMGAKSMIIAPDNTTVQYVRERTRKPFRVQTSDPDAEYWKNLELDVSELEPQVALPHHTSNVKPVTEVEGTKIDQVFLGSCTNGRLEDLRVAAQIMKNRTIHPNVRMIVIPASQEVFSKALEEGIIQTFIASQAAVYSSTCGPCFGGHIGLLAAKEVCLTTSNRNFRGRMGSKDSQLYLVSPATAAASAISGEITDPRKFI